MAENRSDGWAFESGDGTAILLVAPEAETDRLTAALPRPVDTVTTTSSIDEAKRFLGQEDIACVVTERTLADGTCRELLETVRSRDDSLPVILWTADADEQLLSDLLGAGLTDYVPRSHPPDGSVIGERIRTAIDWERGREARANGTLSWIAEFSTALADATSVETGLQVAISDLCELTEWAYAEFWVPDSAGDRLRYGDAYRLNDDHESFRTLSETTTFTPGEGLPGRVWETGRPEWIHDVSDLPSDEYIRADEAANAGLHAAYAVPIHGVDEHAAVFVCYLPEPRLPDERLKRMVETVGAGFAQLVQRTQLQSQHQGDGLWETDLDRSDIDHQPALLEAIAEHIDLTLWVTTPEFDEILYASPYFEEFSGYDLETFSEDPERLLEIVHPADRDRVREVWLNRTEPFEHEYRVETADGEVHWIHEQGSPVEINGEVAYVVGKAEDVTAEKEREQELERQQELLRHTEAIAKTGGWEADLETGTQRWTQGTRDIHGVDEEFEPTVSKGIEFFHPADRDEIERVFTRCAEHGEPYDVELCLVTAAGETRWVRARGEPIRENGSITGVRGAIQDITARKERERQQEQAETFFQHARDSMFIIDVDEDNFTVSRVNPAYESLFGLSSETLEGAQPADIFDDEVAAGIRDQYRSCIETGEAVEFAETFPVNGQDRHLETRLAPVKVDGDVEQIVGVIRDVTERKHRTEELEATRKRYQSLIEAAPDPIFVADADTGEIVEVNGAAVRLRKQPREEIIGCHFTDLHPDEDAERYQRAFEDQLAKTAPLSKFADGSQLYLETAAGDRIPISISSSTVQIGERTLVHGIFRDISDQHRYEESLRGVNEAAQRLLQDETDAEIAQTVVEVAGDILACDAAAVYRYDDHAGHLAPVAVSDQFAELLEEPPAIDPGNGILWETFTEGDDTYVADVRPRQDPFAVGTPIRTLLLVPMGEHGVLVFCSAQIDACDSLCRDIAGTLSATAADALSRAQQTQALRERERESSIQAERLERVQQLNDEIRAIMKAVVESRSRVAIAETLSSSLVTLDAIDCAWVAQPDANRDELDITATAGAVRQYLSELPLDIDDENQLPAVQAVRERQSVVEPNIASHPHAGAWRQQALVHELRTVMSVPLVHGDILYGVLTLGSSEPGRFDDLTQEVLTELGSLIGYALNALDQRNALLEDETVTLRFDITGADDTFIQVAADLQTTLHVENISSQPGQGYLVHGRFEHSDPESVAEALDAHPTIREHRHISESDDPLFEMALVGECLATRVSGLGANVHSMQVEQSRCQLVVSIPRDRDKTAFVSQLEATYPDVELKAQKSSAPETSPWERRLEHDLTERQQEILRTAFFSGYFDQPRQSSGQDVAEALGISQPAFSKQLRTSQRRILSSLYESE